MFQKQPIKSPLRYPGGKSRAIEQICEYMPAHFTEFREPFVGGGSVFIYLRQRFPHIKIWINDLNQELYYFWKVAQAEIENLMCEIQRVKDNTNDGRELFTQLTTANVNGMTEFERAVRFFVLNRITFSGTVESGGYSQEAFEKRFTDSSIKRLLPLSNLLVGVKITNLDYKEAIQEQGNSVFIFLDPPYLSATNSRLYGKRGTLHTSFNHKEFADVLKECNHKWLVTYDDSPQIRNNFEFANLYEWELQYGMNNYKQDNCEPGKELFVTNYQVENFESAKQASLFV